MNKLYIALFCFALFCIASAQLDVGDSGDFSHFVAGNFRRTGWQESGEINAWSTSSSRWTGLGGAGFTGGSVSDVAAVGTDGLLAVGTFSGVNGKSAIGIAYFNGSDWCGFPHLNLYVYTPVFQQDTAFPRAQAQANGRAYAVYRRPNTDTYYVYGGRTSFTGNTGFNMIGSDVRIGVAGLVRLDYANGNFTVNTSEFTYKIQPSGWTAAADTPTNRATGYPAGKTSAPAGVVRGTKLRVLWDGNTPVFFARSSTSNLAFWRDTYNQWVTIGTGLNVNISDATGTFTWTDIPSTSYNDFDIGGNDVFVIGNWNTTVGGKYYYNVAKFTYTNGRTQTFNIALNPTSAMRSNAAGTIANYPFVAIYAVDANNYYVSGSQVNSNPNVGATTEYTRRWYVYNVASNTPTIVGGTTSATFLNTGDTTPYTSTSNPITKLWVNGGNVYAFGTFNVYNYNIQTTSVSRAPIRFTELASGWAVFSGGSWSPVYGGGMLNGDTRLVPSALVATTNYVYVFAAGATRSYNTFTNGLVGFDNREHFKSFKSFNFPRPTLRGNVLSGSSFPVGSDGSFRTVHFLKSQRDGVDDAVLVGGQFDWLGLDMLGSVAFVRVRTSSYESVGGGLWVDSTSTAFTGDQSVPQFSAGKVNDFEERSDVLYAGGLFNKNSNGQCLGNVAKLNFKDTNAVWVGLGNKGCSGEVYDLLVDGSKVYVGGNFGICGNEQGTRNIAYFDEDDDEWEALNTGLNGAVYAMIKFRGKLFVGGSFTQASSIRTGTSNGVARWDGDDWEQVISRCQVDCDVGRLEYPFLTSVDPVSRSTRQVRSFRIAGGRLYANAQLPSGGSYYLLQWNGNTWRQMGVSTSLTTCEKQGCLASNQSEVIAINFQNGAQTDYNPRYQEYDPDENVWEQTLNGFDGTALHIAASSSLTFSLFLLLVVSVIVIFF